MQNCLPDFVEGLYWEMQSPCRKYMHPNLPMSALSKQNSVIYSKPQGDSIKNDSKKLISLGSIPELTEESQGNCSAKALGFTQMKGNVNMHIS